MPRRAILGTAGIGLLAVLGALSGTGLGKDPGATLNRPPQSLAAYYPPTAKRAEYPLAMLQLGRIMGAAFQEIYDRKFEPGEKDLAALREQYRSVAALVPEWKGYFPEAPLNALAEKVKARASEAELRAATAQVEAVCTNCHVQEMARVQALYRWKPFARVATPTRSGSSISFHQVMIEVSNLLAALPHNAGQKNFELAGQSYQSLSEQFDYLEGLCVNCHDEPREYFVDKSVKGRLMRMAGMVRAQNPNAAEYEKLVGEIYQQSCIPCHAIHMPPAFLQMQMGMGNPG